MSITLGELLIKLTAKTDAFQKGMNDAKRLAFDSSGDIVASLGRIGESLGKLKFDNLNQVAASLNRVGGIVAGVAVGIATASIAAAEHVALQAKEIDKLSQSYGLSVQQISSFRVAAQITGVSLDTITSGMSRLAKNAATVAESVGGSSSRGAGAAFKALGINVTDSHGKLLPLNDLLGTVADKFSKMENGTTKTALAVQIFGRSGAALIPFLNEGKEGLDRLRQVSDDLGLTWGQKDITAAKEFAENIELLKLKSEALEEQFVKGLLPSLNNIVTAFTKVDSSGDSLAHTLGEGLGSVLKDLAEAAAVLGHDFDVIYLSLKQLADPTASPLSLFSNRDSVKAYEDQLKSLDQQLNDVYRTLEKTHQSLLDTFPAEGGDLAGRFSALAQLFGNSKESAPALGGGTTQIKNWKEFADLLEKRAKDALDLLKTTTAEILELEEKITKELRDQHALKDFPVNLKFNPVVPQQSPDNTTRDRFNADRLKKYNDSLKDTQNLLGLQASIFEQTETSAQKYNFALQQLGVLLQKRLIDQETFNRAVNNLGTLSSKGLDGARAFFQQYADAAKETGRQVYDALSNAFEGINNNLAELVVKGKADWKSLLDDIETSIVKIGLQKVEGSLITTIGKALGVDLGGGKPTGAAGSPLHTVVDNLPGAVPGASQSGGGLGGLLGGILGKIGGFFTGGATSGGDGFDFGDFTGRASGGPVSAGVLYRVNENHTEYFKPGVNGRVLPLAPAGADGMGMGGFTYAPTYNISTPDADSFRKSPSQTLNQGLDAAQRASRRR